MKLSLRECKNMTFSLFSQKFIFTPFWPPRGSKIGVFGSNGNFFEGSLSLDLAEISLKSYSKCLLICFSTRTLGKIHKVGFRGLSGGKIALFWAILSHICPFFEIFCLFLQFSILESCYIWFTISLSILVHMCRVVALEKFKIRVCQGVSGGA